MKLQLLRAFLLLLLVPMVGQAFQSEPCVEVLIPKGMPIKIEAQRDQSDSQILKFTIRRIVPKDARRAKITTVMVDRNGIVQYLRPRVGNNLSDPMSIATADTSIARILLVVGWLETDRGKWVMDTKTQDVDIELLVKQGAKALPQSKFIVRE